MTDTTLPAIDQTVVLEAMQQLVAARTQAVQAAMRELQQAQHLLSEPDEATLVAGLIALRQRILIRSNIESIDDRADHRLYYSFYRQLQQLCPHAGIIWQHMAVSRQGVPAGLERCQRHCNDCGLNEYSTPFRPGVPLHERRAILASFTVLTDTTRLAHGYPEYDPWSRKHLRPEDTTFIA